jgi:hypothetical protein
MGRKIKYGSSSSFLSIFLSKLCYFSIKINDSSSKSIKYLALNYFTSEIYIYIYGFDDFGWVVIVFFSISIFLLNINVYSLCNINEILIIFKNEKLKVFAITNNAY